MKAWSLYYLATGQLTGTRFYAQEDSALLANVPAGCGVVAGEWDEDVHEVNLETREVQQVKPRRPSVDHEWSDSDGWVISELVRRRSVLRQIAELEAAQARPLREVTVARALGEHPPQAATDRLLLLEQQIAELRATISTTNEKP